MTFFTYYNFGKLQGLALNTRFLKFVFVQNKKNLQFKIKLKLVELNIN